MNIYDYIKYYGDYSFDDRIFNEVDNIVFSMLAYVNYEGIINKTITIKDAYDLFLNTYDPNKKELLAIKNGIKVFELVSKTKRYEDIEMSNYIYKSDEKSQFSAVTFKIKKNLYYVAFEGTDEMLSGWEEDCKMAYHFPVEAHVLAKSYLEKNFMFKRGKIIVGGHSKGGNLALVASMYCNSFVKKKIIKIYSNDGQGLRKAQIESKFYNKIESRYVHIIPNYSIVGLLLRHKKNYVVVKSNKKGFMAHDACTWLVSYDHLEKENISRFSKVFEDGFDKWLDKYDDEKRKKFVKEVFNFLRKNNINDLTEVKLKKDFIVNIVKTSKDIDPIVKEMALDLFKVISKTNFEYKLF